MDEILTNGSTTFYSENWIQQKSKDIKGFLNIEDIEGVPVRIGISGAPGVGKNELAKKIARTLDIPCIERIPRTVKSLGYKLNKKATIDAEIAIWLAQLNEQLNYLHFVTDSTVIDIFAYMKYISAHYELEIQEYLVRAIGNITSGIALEQYSIIFYLPPRETIQSNGIRSTDKNFQAEIDDLITSILTSFGIDYITLSGDMETKYHTAISYITTSGLIQSLFELPEE